MHAPLDSRKQPEFPEMWFDFNDYQQLLNAFEC